MKTASTRKALPEFRVDGSETGGPLWPYLYWYDHKARLRFYLPPERLVMHGAYPYAGGWHPLVAAQAAGPKALDWFYQEHQPADLAAMYRLPATGETGEGLPPWELPWFAGARRRSPSGEAGLGLEHGVSYYGPATGEKIALECRRLGEIATSIRRDGYQPEAFGDIDGFFMRMGDEYRFFVRGGKHRAAVLAFLGNGCPVPVTFKEGWPRVVDLASSGDWPLVRSGACSEAFARAVFVRYFEGNPLMACAPAL